MGKYAILQLKRLGRVLFWIVPAMAALMLCLGLGGKAILEGQSSDKDRQAFPIGLVGMPEDGLLRLGLSAIESLDGLGFAVDFIELSPQEAPQALETGRVSAYVVIPEGFMSAAYRGEIMTVEYVTTPQAAGIHTLFEKEVTAIIGQVLLQSEKASFGSYDALAPVVGEQRAGEVLDQLSQDLARFIFLRSRTGNIRLLGFESAPSFAVYLGCGLSVTLALMIALSFAPVCVQQELEVNILLQARGRSGIFQGIVDYFVVFIGETVVIALLLLVAKLLAPGVRLRWLAPVLPVCALAAALAFFCFSLTRQLLGGVLVYFFTAVCLALVCGCMYPVWFFPVSVQRMAALLPVGLAREYLTAGIAGMETHALWGLLAYTALFIVLGIVLRAGRIRRNG